LLHSRHRGEVIVCDGLVMSAGIDHGAGKVPVPEKALNGCDAAARIKQLRRARMSECNTSYLPGQFVGIFKL